MEYMTIRKKYVLWCSSIAVVAAVIAGIPNDEAQATPTSLGTDTLQSWAWNGLPVDQNVATGSDTTSTLGFIHLNCDSWSTCSGGAFNTSPDVQIDTDTGDVSGWAWVGNTSAASDYSVGWLNFDPDPLTDATYADASCTSPNYFPAPPCHAAQIDTSNDQTITGWARFETLAAYGDTMLGTTGGNNNWGWVLLNGTNTADGDDFGVIYRDGALEGWAWSGGGTLPSGSFSNEVGFGWINFSSGGSGSVSGPTGGYLSTDRGDVYSRDGISNPPGTLSPSQYNATFLLLGSGGTGSIVNFDSELLGEGNFTAENLPDFELPDSTNDYTNDFGGFDFDKLETVVSGSENVYGDEIVTLPSFATLSGDESLDGKVIIIDGGSTTQYTISDAITFMNGTAAGEDGSGVIIVEGDLLIDSNLYYNNTALTDLKNLASVAWIVKGDLTIGENVNQIVGSFFVIGDDSIGDGLNDGTVTTEATNASQLIVYGLMMGRSFTFQRTYEGVYGQDEPAELIYYDGRIISNPPPGLRDFSSVLPIISSE